MKESVFSVPAEVDYLRGHPEALHMVRLFMKDQTFFEAWEQFYLCLRGTSATEITQEEAFLLTHAGALGIIREFMRDDEESAKFRLINSYANLIE